MIVSSGYNIGGPEVEEALGNAPRRRRGRPSSRAPDAERGSIVCAFVVLRDGVDGRRRQGQGAPGPRQGPAGAVQVPARRALRRRAAAQHQREDAALQAAPDDRVRRTARGRHEDRDRGRRAGRALLRRPDEVRSTRPTRSPSGSATPPTTPSASAWCSPTRPSAASRAPTASSTSGWSSASPAGPTSTSRSPTGRRHAVLHRRRPGLRGDVAARSCCRSCRSGWPSSA